MLEAGEADVEDVETVAAAESKRPRRWLTGVLALLLVAALASGVLVALRSTHAIWLLALAIVTVPFMLPTVVVGAAFLALAIGAGMNCPITDPLDDDLHYSLLAADLLRGKDSYAQSYLRYYRKQSKGPAQS